MWVPALLATSAGCALVGYDLSGYGSGGTSSTATGAGGAASAGTPGSTASQSTGTSESVGAGGRGGNPCSTSADCKDPDPCTIDACDNTAHCTSTLDPTCCRHSVCTPGGLPLDGGACVFGQQAYNCVATVCGTNPACCSSGWSQECVEAAKLACLVGGLEPISCSCTHSYCVTGEALNPSCDPCVRTVCSSISSCCSGSWTADCVTATHVFCHVQSEPYCQ
jgi:hypothetical protein